MSQPVEQSTEGNGAMDAIKQTLQKNLSLSKILSDIGNELKDQAAHGSHEMAAVLFRGDAFVMYPRTSHIETPDHGLTEAQQEQDRGGRE